MDGGPCKGRLCESLKDDRGKLKRFWNTYVQGTSIGIVISDIRG